MTSDLYRQNFKLIDWSKPLPEIKREQRRVQRA